MKTKDKYKDLKEFFSIIAKDVKFDKHLWKELLNFRLRFITKNDEHSEFFGDKLFGVHIVRFSALDDIELVENIYGLDLNFCMKEIYKVEGIDKNHKVASNFIYHLLLYTMHRFALNKDMNRTEKDLRKYLMEPLLIMEYRMFSSLYTWYFKFKVPKEVAIAALRQMSNKFLIKKLDSWEEFFEERINDFIGKDSIYYKRLIRYTTEDAINIIITLQTKLRSVVKNIAREIYDVLEKNNAIKTEEMFYQDGKLKETSQGLRVMIENIKLKYNSGLDFVDADLAKFIEKYFNNLPDGMLVKMLKFVATDDKHIDRKKMSEVLEKIIVIDYEYLNRIDINPLDKTQVLLIITNLKNYWSSSKVKNPEMEKIKKYLYKVSMLATGRKTSWMNVANVIAFTVYVYVFALKIS